MKKLMKKVIKEIKEDRFLFYGLIGGATLGLLNVSIPVFMLSMIIGIPLIFLIDSMIFRGDKK